MSTPKEKTNEPKPPRDKPIAKEAAPTHPTVNQAVSEPSASPAPEKIVAQTSRADIDLHALIPCINGTHGYLIYVSGQTRDIYEWHNFGDVNYIELGELVTLKRTQRRFFTQNWLLIEDREILKFLQVDQYYADTVTSENFDQIFACAPDEIADRVAPLSSSLKESVRKRAAELIRSGEIDSRKMIAALEDALQTTFA